MGTVRGSGGVEERSSWLSLKTQKVLIVPKYSLLSHALRPLLTGWLGLFHTPTTLLDSRLTNHLQAHTSIGSPLYFEPGSHWVSLCVSIITTGGELLEGTTPLLVGPIPVPGRHGYSEYVC